MDRDDGSCVLCGAPHDHVHHIKTRGAGGKHVAANLVCICWRCHEAVHRDPDRKRALLAECRWRGILPPEG